MGEATNANIENKVSWSDPSTLAFRLHCWLNLLAACKGAKFPVIHFLLTVRATYLGSTMLSFPDSRSLLYP